jgi:HlyD family secretion protein
MKPWIKWLSILFVVLEVGAGAFLLYEYLQPKEKAKSNVNSSTTSKANDPLTFVSALGRIEPRGRVIRLTASPAVEGARLAQLLVKEGDEIKIGQIVAVLDSQQRLQTAVLEAERQVGMAKAKLAQVQSGAKGGDISAQEAVLRRLELEQQNARTELERSERLHSSGDVPASEVESRKLTLNTIAKEIIRNQAVLTALQEVRPTDVQFARAEIESLQAVVVRVRANLELTNVRSLTNGRVLKIHVAPGEAVSSSDTKGMFEIGETDQMYAVAEIFEADIHRVQAGQTVELTVRTTNQILHGEVESIGLQIGKRNILDNDPVADLDSRVVEVRIRLHDADSRTVAGLTNLRVDARINAQKHEGGTK